MAACSAYAARASVPQQAAQTKPLVSDPHQGESASARDSSRRRLCLPPPPVVPPERQTNRGNAIGTGTAGWEREAEQGVTVQCIQLGARPMVAAGASASATERPIEMAAMSRITKKDFL